MKYPRVLVVALGRINTADTSNNGLLLRNLFAGWPRENLAQVYSGGGNGDEGFFGRHYPLGVQDRSLGNLFFRLKADEENNQRQQNVETDTHSGHKFFVKGSPRILAKRLFFETGLYEIVFRPKVSRKMLAFVKDFHPDIIFAQGYSLAFTWLPVLLKKITGAKLAFFCTDDWPGYLYSGQLGESTKFTWLMRPFVNHAVYKLMAAVDIPFAFGQPMASEYSARYGKSFIGLAHGDDPQRFLKASSIRVHSPGIISIIAVGNFNQFRWPLLLDANKCCQLLEAKGYHARVAVFSTGINPAGTSALAKAQHIDIFPDPGNDLLPGYLKGADILLLIEGFDTDFVSAIRLSVSSKSHLFMFSQRPIVVYGHPDTGVCKYASDFGWAKTVTKRDAFELFSAIQDIIKAKDENENMISRAYDVAQTFHLRDVNHEKFLNWLSGKPTFAKNLENSDG